MFCKERERGEVVGIERGKEERDREGEGEEREKGGRGGVGREGKRKCVFILFFPPIIVSH